MDHNEEFLYGSARFADQHDLQKEGLFSGKGIPVGFWGNRQLHFDTDGPGILIAGSGAGKLRDDLAYKIMSSKGEKKVILDIKGELRKVSEPAFAFHKEHIYTFNPFRMHGLPHDNMNPLEFLTPDSPTLHSDCAFIMQDLIPLSGSANGEYFEQRGQSWGTSLTKSLAIRDGYVSFPSLYRLISQIESDPIKWASHLEYMLESPHTDLRRTAGEMLAKQQDSPKEFSGIMGTIYNHLDWLDEPQLCNSLEESEFSIADFITNEDTNHLFVTMPAQSLRKAHPFLRALTSAINVLKERHPSAPRINMIIDEAAQLRSFSGLQDMMTFSRGVGVKPLIVFQDIGQIRKFHGQHALATFIGSAIERRIYGIRDSESAEYFSKMIGTTTQHYNDTLKQSQAAKSKREAAHDFLENDDPFAAAMNFHHFEQAQHTRSKMARRMKTPEEIMNMSSNEMLLFLAGDNPMVVEADKYPYYQQRFMAGLYGPNPYHPPIDRVQVMTRWGKRWRQYITEAVPQQYADYPQYKNGNWSYVEGYRPK